MSKNMTLLHGTILKIPIICYTIHFSETSVYRQLSSETMFLEFSNVNIIAVLFNLGHSNQVIQFIICSSLRPVLEHWWSILYQCKCFGWKLCTWWFIIQHKTSNYEQNYLKLQNENSSFERTANKGVSCLG